MGARPGTGSALPAASRVEFGHSSMQGTPLLFTHDLTGNERKSSNTRSLLLDRVSDRVTPFLSVELQTPQGQAESSEADCRAGSFLSPLPLKICLA